MVTPLTLVNITSRTLDGMIAGRTDTTRHLASDVGHRCHRCHRCRYAQERVLLCSEWEVRTRDNVSCSLVSKCLSSRWTITPWPVTCSICVFRYRRRPLTPVYVRLHAVTWWSRAVDSHVTDHATLPSVVWSCSLELSTSSRSRLIFSIIMFLQPSQNWTFCRQYGVNINRSMFVIA